MNYSKVIKTIILGLLSLTALNVRADTTKNPTGPWYMQDYNESSWRIDGLVGLSAQPTFPGSDETETGFAPFVRYMVKDKYNNRYAIYPLGISGSFDLSDNLNFSLQLEYEAGGDGESADFEGLDEIEDTIDGNFLLSYRWGSSYIYASLQPDVLGKGKGLVWFYGGGYDWQINKSFALRTKLGLTGGDNTHMDTEFNITSEESARTGLKVYDPEGGVKNIEFSVQAEYTHNKYWSIFSATQLENYLGEAADSPLSKSDVTVRTLFGVLFRY